MHSQKLFEICPKMSPYNLSRTIIHALIIHHNYVVHNDKDAQNMHVELEMSCVKYRLKSCRSSGIIPRASIMHGYDIVHYYWGANSRIAGTGLGLFIKRSSV